MKSAFLIVFLSFFAVGIQAQKVTFRGVNHCGIYPNEKNLLKQWPAEGPEKLWVVENAGKGNSSALVSDGFIYTAGLLMSILGACFSHPTIFDGVLYIWRGKALMAYNLKDKS